MEREWICTENGTVDAGDNIWRPDLREGAARQGAEIVRAVNSHDDLVAALHSLLGELRYVHAHGDVRDSIRNSEGTIAAAVAALVKAGTSLPVVDGDVNADTYGTATTAAEAIAVAQRYFADPVVAAECYGPIQMANGDTLPLAWVALTRA